MKSRKSWTTVEKITRWIVTPIVLLCLVGLVGSNILLQTKLARGWVERKLERRSGFEWTLARASWTPWTGIQFGGVKAELKSGLERAEPVYAADRMQLQPYWGSLFMGKFVVREVRLSGMRVAVPIELLALTKANGAKMPGGEEDPGVAAAPPSSIPPPEPQPRDPGPKKAAPGPPAPATSAPPSPVAKSPMRPKANRPSVLILEDCEMSVYSLSGEGTRRVTLKGLEAELPLAGEDATGWIGAAAVTLGGEEVSGPLKTKVEWKRPLLILPATEVDWQGLKIRTVASLRARGAPMCRMEVRILPGKLEPLALKGVGRVEMEAERVEGLARFSGSLITPRSWNGDGILEVDELYLGQRDGLTNLKFYSGRFASGMRGGNVSVVDARLLSEQLSFLGNGVVLSDGRVFGVVRVVADRRHAEFITRLAVGSFISGGWTESWLTPLGTPDRQYRDVHLRGTLQAATVDVGKRGETLGVDIAWQRMLAFVNHEAREEQSELPVTRGRERIPIPQ